ncbi:hypothetical protein [Myxacorys almedinensis]|uniref:Uncharacterized protein n=1 Tax=Myxacorys almedinensis A TaxID=2690445 RepID=A0A8J7Z852_9CYAN|nr:hypothetical protein [Myxacorys almedinensis]NDJ19793.1 hypothetical protein [Myxacorys almedinensis A]
MPILSYALILPFVLVALMSVMVEIKTALDDFDLERFVLWVGVASAISALPLVL